ncbi:hypothetical protein CFIO01_02860 [Colletotrichum fioriniae PJ7]|uniref:Uncharacterized protein n=1 Tax=Colletotrichum fioriniae PJ7 TaxID=1445577 RepID=A0A010RN53_9PEZI|nr:hypothetical protein CFIO01_02860 [Colletotrichum fioriniae PJ7]
MAPKKQSEQRQILAQSNKPEESEISEQSEGQPSPQTASCQALIHTVCPQYLTTKEAEQIIRQFESLPWLENKQVLWSGVEKTQAQEWADNRGMQTLTTAMGPLMDSNNPFCLKSKKGSKAWSKYMKGASLVFAWRISQGSFTTVLTPPPPERFHPDGLTNYQDIEEPVLKGRLGTPTSCRIFLAHPTVHGAQDFRYQIWPVDFTDQWFDTFKVNERLTHAWRTISKHRTITKWVRTTDEHLKPAPMVKMDQTGKAMDAPLLTTSCDGIVTPDEANAPNSTFSINENTHSSPILSAPVLQIPELVSQTRTNTNIRIDLARVNKSSDQPMTTTGPVTPQQRQNVNSQTQADAGTQTVQAPPTIIPHVYKIPSDEAATLVASRRPQSQQSISQTQGKAEMSRAIPFNKTTTSHVKFYLGSAYPLPNEPDTSQVQRDEEASQANPPSAPVADQQSMAEDPSDFLICLHLAILEMTLSLLLVSIGMALLFMAIIKELVKIEATEITEDPFGGDLAPSKRKAILRAARKARREADPAIQARKAARREAKKARKLALEMAASN